MWVWGCALSLSLSTFARARPPPPPPRLFCILSHTHKAAVRFAHATPPLPASVPTAPDPAWPRAAFAAFGDAPRNAAFGAGIARAVARARGRAGARGAGRVAALVLASPAGRAGFLACLAARAGADTVVALEPLPAAASLARRLAGVNGVGERVVVLCGGPAANPAALRLGTDPAGPLPPSGINLFICDAWDAFLLGNGADAALASVRAAVGCASPVVVPAAARLWCVGVNAETARVEAEPGQAGAGGHRHHPLDAFRWAPTPTTVDLDVEPHALLTGAACVAEVALDAPEGEGRGGGGGRRAAVARTSAPFTLAATAPGRLTAVALWTDLVLDEEEGVVYSTAPSYAGPGGVMLVRGGEAGAGEGEGGTPPPPPPPPPRHRHPPFTGQALQALDRWTAVQPGHQVRLVVRYGPPAPGNAAGLRIALRRPPPPTALAADGTAAAAAAPSPPSGWAPRPPWCEAWGGGDSVENPHVQRVRYGALVRQEWAARVRAGAAGREGGEGGSGGGGGGGTAAAAALALTLEDGEDDAGAPPPPAPALAAAAADGARPSIAADLRAVAAQAGALGLDPPTVAVASASLVLEERLHVTTRARGGGVYGGEAAAAVEGVAGWCGGWLA